MIKKILIAIGIVIVSVGILYAQGSMYEEPGNEVVSGVATVSVASTAVPLSSTSTRVLDIQLQWYYANTQPRVWIGGSTVTVNNGMLLTSGSILTLKVNDLSDVYVVSASANDKITYIAVTR